MVPSDSCFDMPRTARKSGRDYRSFRILPLEDGNICNHVRCSQKNIIIVRHFKTVRITPFFDFCGKMSLFVVR